MDNVSALIIFFRTTKKRGKYSNSNISKTYPKQNSNRTPSSFNFISPIASPTNSTSLHSMMLLEGGEESEHDHDNDNDNDNDSDIGFEE